MTAGRALAPARGNFDLALAFLARHLMACLSEQKPPGLALASQPLSAQRRGRVGVGAVGRRNLPIDLPIAPNFNQGLKDVMTSQRV
jgi:hypothetical protein